MWREGSRCGYETPHSLAMHFVDHKASANEHTLENPPFWNFGLASFFKQQSYIHLLSVLLLLDFW